MSKNILVPVDGSERSLKALDFASDIAAKDGSTLHVLHVVPEYVLPEGLRQWAAAEHVQAPSGWIYEQAIADYVLDVAIDRVSNQGQSPVVKITENGDAAKRIVEVARRHSIDMIIMGTRGLSDLEGFFMGSVAHKVNHLAECTVVTVR